MRLQCYNPIPIGKKTRDEFDVAGFTLVELMITVAIIGVLAVMGIPAYQRMVQKSRQGESKVELAYIADLESTFFSEYAAYGNNLLKMGAQMTRADGVKYYASGFFQANCGCPQPFLPLNTSGPGLVITKVFPAYFVPDPTVGDCAIGWRNFSVCYPTDVGADPFQTYTALSQGYIVSEKPAITPTTADLDVWSIDQDRLLSQVQSGIR